MSQTTEVLKHILRTFLLVMGLAAVVLVLPFIVPSWEWYIAALVIFVLLIVFGTARLHALWAPISDRVERLKWQDEKGEAYETVVEAARISAATFGGASAIKSRVLRVSVYSVTAGKRRARRLIGDSARYLGRFGDGFWFFIEDRFHSGKNGLVCVDPRTAKFIFHLPRKAAELTGPEKGRSHIITLTRGDREEAFDLRRPVADMTQG